MANLFMAHLEKSWTVSDHAPLCYFRYIDDIFCIFDSNTSDPHDFLNYLNVQHDNLCFTSEIGVRSLPFLDVLVSSSDNRFDLNIFRKDTYTSLLLNFHAYCPYRWKIGLINCMLYRAYRVCNSWRNFQIEVDNLKTIFLKNSYPLSVFNRVVNKFVSKMLSSCTERQKTDKNPVYLILPYFGKVSDRFQLRVNSLAKRFNLNIKLVFKPFKVGQYFSLKSCVPRYLQSGVVYKFTCSRDVNTTYIGKTRRHLFTRIAEHSNPQRKSAVVDHRLTCTCGANMDDFSVIKSCRNDFDLGIVEALLIKKYKPTLNQTISNNGRSIFLKLF